MNTLKKILLSLLAMYCVPAFAQNVLKKDSITVKKIVEKKEEENRNVMLNAANNSGPREVNVGLPSSVGGTTILENDLPVVYYFWPELPNRTWRSSVSLSKTGLLGLKETSITTADFGFAVNSYTKLGTEKTEIAGNLAGSHFGWLKGDINVSGPLSKDKSWSYSAGIFQNYDPQSFDVGFTDYSDKTQIYRAGITKRFKNGKGEISLLYKYAKSLVLTNYAAFRYQEGGSISELDNFRVGRDSYILREGNVRVLNALNGEYYNLNMGNDLNTKSHNIDLLGSYQLGNDWKFKYTLRFHKSFNTTQLIVPTSSKVATAGDGFTYMNGTPYLGTVQSVLAFTSPDTELNSFQSRFEVLKTKNNHKWRFGLTEAYFDEGQFAFNQTFYYQEVAAQPRQLTNYNAITSSFAKTDQYGFYNYNVGANYHSGIENKITAYATDDWQVNDKFKLSYGLNFRYHKMKGNYSLDPRGVGYTIVGKTLTPFDHNWFHIGASVNAVYNLGKNFGVIADLIYTEKNGNLEDYSAAYTPNFAKTKSPYASAGVFFNHPKISIVSALTYLTRNNYQTRLNLVNPSNVTQNQLTPVFYDIQTKGWTTDIVAKPVRNFSLHYLLTIQDPVYKNYNFNAFGNNYSYNGKSVLQISKVLMEIDPSYTTTNQKFRAWASLRYFSKQYANLTNALFFKGWWETFAGVNYQFNKSVGGGLTVVNPLNQRGAKGTINGTELATDASPYYGQLLTSSYIRPFTVEASVNFKF